jgi:hypothetical protein
MAFAAVVSFVDSTKSVNVAAYTVLAKTTLADHARRPRRTMSRAIAAIPDRRAETCNPENVATLIPAPPVENKTAAASVCSRAVAVTRRVHRLFA